jgi:acetyl-CoA carboxylase carboxyltransferase component
MTDGVGGIYSTAPGAFNEMGEDSDVKALGGAAVHAEKTGLAHFKCASEDDTFNKVQQLLSYLPDNNIVDASMVECTDDLNRLIQNYEDSYDSREMISSVMDNGVFFEVQAAFAPSILTGFARINGRTVGAVANASGAEIDSKSAEKAAGFVSFCDAFGIPIVTFTDTPGFVKDKAQEQCCLIPSGGRLIRAFAEATVPMLTVITGKAIGAGYIAMAPKALGADMVFAWPNAQISCVSAEAAAIILSQDAEVCANTFASPWEAAKMGYVDVVIYPSETRQRLVGALELALGKRENKLPKKHGTRL